MGEYPEDRRLRDELLRALKRLEPEYPSLAFEWNYAVLWGSNVEETLAAYLATATVILVLVSPALLASQLCRDLVAGAVQRFERGDDIFLVPIYLRVCDQGWREELFQRTALIGLPHGGKAIEEFPARGEVYRQIVGEFRRIIVP